VLAEKKKNNVGQGTPKLHISCTLVILATEIPGQILSGNTIWGNSIGRSMGFTDVPVNPFRATAAALH
jgi:hypothetical protein